MMKKTWIFLTLTVVFFAFDSFSAELNTGPWRFELRTTYATIPFLAEINKTKSGFTGKIFNGKETIKLTDISYNKDRKRLSIPLQTFELTLELKIEEPGLMSGYLVRHNKNPKTETPIRAFHGKSERFLEKKAPATIDLDGRWALEINEDGKISKGVGLFEQKGNKFSGSILTPTGDYRYMEGYVSGDIVEAASFDGVYNYLFRGKVANKELKGQILSNVKTQITGKPDPNAVLPDAYSQTQVEEISFIFPDLKDQMVSLNHEKFKNKPVIIQIFGTWCPNCLDEMNFLIPWYNNERPKDVEVVAIAFERSLNLQEAKMQLMKVQKKKKVPYTLLLAGATAQEKPEDKIPQLKNFISFPTTIFLDKKHRVYKVHAGFTGPSTGEFYKKWKSEFKENVKQISKK